MRWFQLCLLTILVLVLSGCNIQLYTNLAEQEVNEMLAVLHKGGLQGEKQPGDKNTWNLLVDETQLAASVELLQNHGYPRAKYETIGQVFQKSGLISSPLEERIRFIYALSQELSKTISQIDGVLASRVHIVLPENNPLQENVQPSSASVFIKYTPGSDVASHIPQIKMLVVNSIEGLSYDKVTAVTVPADIPPDTFIKNEVYEKVLGVKLVKSTASRFWLLFGSMALLVVLAFASAGYFGFRLYSHSRTQAKKPAKQVNS